MWCYRLVAQIWLLLWKKEKETEFRRQKKYFHWIMAKRCKTNVPVASRFRYFQRVEGKDKFHHGVLDLPLQTRLILGEAVELADHLHHVIEILCGHVVHSRGNFDDWRLAEISVEFFNLHSGRHDDQLHGAPGSLLNFFDQQQGQVHVFLALVLRK